MSKVIVWQDVLVARRRSADYIHISSACEFGSDLLYCAFRGGYGGGGWRLVAIATCCTFEIWLAEM